MGENCVRVYEELQQVKVFSMENEGGAKTRSLNSSFQRLQGELVKTFGATISGILYLEKIYS